MAGTLGSFAIRRALFSSIIAGCLNLIIVYFALRGEGEVPLFAAVADIWNHSLIGALIPRSIVISFLVTIVTFIATIKEVSKNKEERANRLGGIPWLKIAIRKALFRALVAFLLIIGLALVLRALFPTYATLSVSIVIPIVAIFAGLVAFSMTYSAVFSTGKMLHSKN